MKRQVFILIMIGILCVSCQSRNEADKPLSDEQIAFNLSKNGENDPALLIGEWDCVKFAYTADGNKISDVAAISKVASWVDVSGTGLPLNKITVFDDNYDPNDYIYSDDVFDRQPGCFWVFWPYYLFYSISDNLIGYKKEGYPYYLMDTFTDEGYDVLNALRNTYSFVIKNNELVIYFTSVENKNLLILKKR